MIELSYLGLGVAIFCAVLASHALFLAFSFYSKRPFNSSADIYAVLLVLAVSLRISKAIFYFVASSSTTFTVLMGLAGNFAIGPIMFLFTLTAFGAKISKWQLVHLAPPLLIVPVCLLFDIESLRMYYLAATLSMGMYVVYGWFMAISKGPKLSTSKPTLEQVLLSGTSMIWIVFITQFLVGGITVYFIGIACITIILYWISYRLSLYSRAKNNEKLKHITPEKTEEVRLLLIEAFETNKVHQDPKLTLAKLSESLKQPSYIVSSVINQAFGKKFPEFINSYRISDIKDELQRGGNLNYTIEGLAQNAGFKTASAFYAAFKKDTGLTPQKFIERHQVA